MAGFSLVSLTGNYGTGVSGSLTFTLSDAMSNSNVISVPTPIVVAVTNGTFSQTFYSNLDAATVPQGIAWCVTEQITGSPVRDYSIFIPPIQTEINGQTFADSNVIQLSSVTASLNMVGQSVTGPNIPSSSVITGVQVGNPTNDPLNPVPTALLNSVTLNNEVTIPGSALTIVIGATIDLSQLMPGAPFWA